MFNLDLRRVRWARGLLMTAVLLGGCVTTEPVKTKDALVFPDPPDEARFVFERTIRSAADVGIGKSGSGGLKAMLAGYDTDRASGLGKPFGVVASQGRVYVGDTVKRVIHMFDPANKREMEIGGEEPGTLAKPMGMSVDDQLNLYVADITRRVVQVYDKEGKYLRTIGTKEELEHPSAVTVTKDGSKVFVVDTGSVAGKPEFHRVVAYDGNSGKLLFKIGRRGSEDGQFNLARAAAVGPDGLLYVVDGGNFRVQVFGMDGKFIRQFGKVGTRMGQFARPKGIATDASGNLYISDASHGNFQIFNTDGQLLLFVGSRGKTDEPASYILPAMISVDEDGRVYMVDQVYQKVDVFRPAAMKEEEGGLGRAIHTTSKGNGTKPPAADAEAAKVPAKK